MAIVPFLTDCDPSDLPARYFCAGAVLVDVDGGAAPTTSRKRRECILNLERLWEVRLPNGMLSDLRVRLHVWEDGT